MAAPPPSSSRSSSILTKLAGAPPGVSHYALLTLLGAVWGASFVLLKVVVATIPAMPATVIRLAITAAFMLAVARVLGHRLPTSRAMWGVVAASAVVGNALPFLLVAWGEEVIDGGLAAILMSPVPLMTALLAHASMPDEKLERRQVAGILLGVIGVIVLIGLDKLVRIGGDTVRQLAVVGAGVCYAINGVISRGLVGGSMIGNVAAVMMLATAMLLPMSLATASWSFDPSALSLFCLVAIAIVSTGLGTLLQVRLIGRQGAAFTGQVNFLVPLFGVLWGALLLAERPSVRSLIGLVLILAGVALARRTRPRGT